MLHSIFVARRCLIGGSNMDEGSAPIRGTGSPEGAAWFRAKLEALGETKGSLARLLIRYGDDRKKATIERQIDRMASGDVRVPGEMRAILGMMERGKAKSAKRAQDHDKHASPLISPATPQN
jgi:hypothetical protein